MSEVDFLEGAGVWTMPVPSFTYYNYWVRQGWKHFPLHQLAPEWANQLPVNHQGVMLTKDPIAACAGFHRATKRARDAIRRATRPSREVACGWSPPAPHGLSYLPFQRAGVRQAIKLYQSGLNTVLIGDEMGLGKTIQALGIINMLHRLDGRVLPVIIVVPASLQLNWAREARKWIINDVVIKVMDGEPSEVANADIVICSYNRAGKASKIRDNWRLCIADEAHYLKNVSTVRAKEVAFDDDSLMQKSDLRLLLTGTPAPNRPTDIWALLNLLDPEQWSNRSSFLRHLKMPKSGWISPMMKDKLEAIQLRARLSGMIRRQKVNVLHDLPDKWRKVVEIKPKNKNEEELISAESKEFSVAVEDEGFQVAARKSGFNQHLMTVRKNLSKLKLERALAYLRATMVEGEKVILFTYFKETTRALVRELGAEAVCIEGGTPTWARQEAVDSFQRDAHVRFFVGQIIAACEGLTLTASHRVVFVDLDWTPARMEQAEDRTHRIGQDKGVLIEYLVYSGSVDERIAMSLHNKTQARRLATNMR